MPESTSQGEEPGGPGKVLAWIGAIGGILGAVLAVITFLDARNLDIRVDPRTFEAQDGFQVLRVAIINNSSQRSVNLVHGRIEFDGEKLADLDEIFTDEREATTSDPAQVRRALRPLPVRIGPGESVAAAFRFLPDRSGREKFLRLTTAEPRSPDLGPPWTPPQCLPEPPSPPQGTGDIDAPVRPPQVPRAQETDRLQLMLDFDPGPTTRTALRIIRVPRSGPSGPEPFRLGDWFVRVDVKGRRPRALSASSLLERPSTVRLQMWRIAEGAPILDETKPVSAGADACFYLNRLPSARYDWAASSAGATVATGRLAARCPPFRLTRQIQSVPAEDCEPSLGR